MAPGILIVGLNGCGKTTIGRMLAGRLGYFCMDNEDYYFPVPGHYANARPEEEAQRLMEEDALRHQHFVLRCARCTVTDAVIDRIGLAVVLRTDPETRARRICQREVNRFGARVLPGGDMYQSQQAFHAFAAQRTEDVVNQTLGRLSCPILEMDAGLSPEEIVQQICAYWQAIHHNQTR